jgi:wyosine [tRNA(Phe)-imidazoG37] synthetase (radical SAM superfamily)
MNYIYGPVKSRRLGSSLGVSVTPYKYCLLDCVYCQLKKTTKLTTIRKEYIKAGDVLLEVDKFLENHQDQEKIDYITISGSGEPLLNSAVKDIISGIRKLTKIPIALITNSVLLTDLDVRKDILDLDLIVPSLDAVTQEVFEKIDKPCDSNIKIYDVIKGLISLRKEFRGKIWLEIMLVRGINDELDYIQNFKTVIRKIKPDKIHLNIPSRPPSEPWVRMPTPQKLKEIKSFLGKDCELI